MFVDSHCHLDFPELSQHLPDVLARMREQRVTHALCISVDLARFPAIRSLVEAHEHLAASIGVHPDQKDTQEPDVDTLCLLANHPKIVAIGETGLDYYWHKETGAGELEWQRERFRVHIRASRRTGKPLVVHTRNAAEDTIRILREEGASPEQGGAGGVMHCFTETWEVAEAALALGFYISFSGIVTFKNAQALRDVAARVPLNRLLIETDSPYLAPVPHRGKTNEPSFVPHVAAEIARVRDTTVDQIAQASTNNFFNLFNHFNA
ncbi:MAG TPA: TatD family hydrolase [Burkholderiaceae bacterium]|nr:TatD family hydrolase [Burkholderiaceae bacterium]